MIRRVAVILSGSGVFDGTEVHEASAVMVNLARNINHAAGAPSENETRSVLAESARIARGKITSLAELDSAKYSGVIVPGGFGAAKNLSTFALDGPENMKVDETV